MFGATSSEPPPITVAATFCATLVDEWVRAGVVAAFVAPGSRSTPMALALAEHPEVAVHVFHDERSAGFAALGHGLHRGVPAVALCSSGTAGAHLHGAVIEADQAGVPLMVVTADRPPELWGVGAPQTIDQNRLFGHSTRFYAEPGVPEEAAASSWRSMASRLAHEAAGWSGRPGPVHLNLSFRDPLVGTAGELPRGRPDGRPWHAASAAIAAPLTDLPALAGRRGVIVAGRGTVSPNAVLTLADTLGWPVLADHRSGCRAAGSVAHFDSLLRIPEFREAVEPEVVVRFGEPLASKSLSQWLAGLGAETISVVPDGRWIDPERVADHVIVDTTAALSMLAAVDQPPMREADRWRWADAMAADAIATVLASEGRLSETEIAREVIGGVEPGSAVVVASSMPIREVEWFAPNRDDIAVYANRGANGIDGTIATATGVASTGVPTTVLVGDVALLHDSSSLVGLPGRPIDLTIVVIDNDGGGIFGFLPQRSQLAPERFEQLFGTPHGTDVAALAASHGISVSRWGEGVDEDSGRDVRLILATTDRAETLSTHGRLHASIAETVVEGLSAFE